MGTDFEALREKWERHNFLLQRLSASPLLVDGSHLTNFLDFAVYGPSHAKHGYSRGAFFKANPSLVEVYLELQREWSEK